MMSAPVFWPGLSLRRTLVRHIFAQLKTAERLKRNALD
jgi:hypothetical protein